MRWVGDCATFLLNPFKFHIGLDDFSSNEHTDQTTSKTKSTRWQIVKEVYLMFQHQDILVGILLLTDRLCEKSIYWDYTSVYLFFSGLWQCWKTKWDRYFFSSFSFQDDLNNHCNALSYLTIVFQADFRECSAGFTGKSELSACDIITVSWRCIVVEWRKILSQMLDVVIIWNVVNL